LREHLLVCITAAPALAQSAPDLGGAAYVDFARATPRPALGLATFTIETEQAGHAP